MDLLTDLTDYKNILVRKLRKANWCVKKKSTVCCRWTQDNCCVDVSDRLHHIWNFLSYGYYRTTFSPSHPSWYKIKPFVLQTELLQNKGKCNKKAASVNKIYYLLLMTMITGLVLALMTFFCSVVKNKAYMLKLSCRNNIQKWLNLSIYVGNDSELENSYPPCFLGKDLLVLKRDIKVE